MWIAHIWSFAAWETWLAFNLLVRHVFSKNNALWCAGAWTSPFSTGTSARLPAMLLSFHWCNTDALQHWSRQNSFPAVQCSSAKRAHSMLVPLHPHLCRFALHTGVQWCNINAPQDWSGQNAFPTVQLCSAKQAYSSNCVNATTPMEICSAYRCASLQTCMNSKSS